MSHVKIMGILNVTPDSFYAQGRWNTHDQAIEQGRKIAAHGADWIDIGGESTRPQATPISEQEELNRVIPVIKALKQETRVPISIDTMKARVAETAIDAGAQLINDVRGFRDADMRIVAAHSHLPICVMHMHETPATMQNNPYYECGIVPFLIEWFKKRIELLLASGVKESQIILDPGIGFGKNVDDNLRIMQNLHQIKELGFPILIGLSRKSFLGKILQKTQHDLLTATLTMNMLAIQNGADIIRVHDIAAHRDLVDILSYKSVMN